LRGAPGARDKPCSTVFRPPRVATAPVPVLPRLHRLAFLVSRNPRYQRGKTMSKKTPAPPAPNGTRFDAYSVREYEANGGEKKSDWTRIGVAFPHSDGKGFNVLLQALPLDGKMVLRLHEKDSAE
jgi:hypothetical protein